MKIVVTGALGHIGSYLIRALPFMTTNCDIYLLDNLITQRYCSLFDLPNIGKYKFLQTDVATADLTDIFHDANCVIHLAAMTDAAGSFDKAQEVEFNNYNATRNVATTCSSLEIPLITLSSTSVYGSQSSLVDEGCLDLLPQSPYAETKIKEESLLANLRQSNDLKYTVLRFGTIFGVSTGMRFHTAVNKFCYQAVVGQPLTVWKSAYYQKRPYLSLDDAVRAICFIINNNIYDGEIYNIVTENSTVQNVVGSIMKFFPSLEINWVDHKIMNQLSYEVSSDKFKSLGFKFTGSLDQGITKTISMLFPLSTLTK